MKLALLVAYDGTSFSGFARQPGARTVQGRLEENLSMLLRADVTTTGAGRTDAGVHAAGQVVSLSVDVAADPARLMRRLNKILAPEICIRAAAGVPDSFDARFSAKRRDYEYRVYRTPTPDPFLDRFALHVPHDLSLAAIRLGARALVGEHDFSAFCRRGQGTLVRRLRAVTVKATDDGLVFKVTADSFCHQMVRSIVGLLLEVGRGRRAPEEVADILASQDRSRNATVAPARGLHLVRVTYRPDPFSHEAAGSGTLSRRR